MDRRDSRRSLRENPSFSSTLLDSIYRSIDGGEVEEELVLYRETTRKKRGSNCTAANGGCGGGFERNWTEKKVSEKVVLRGGATFERKSRSEGHGALHLNSRSSCSMVDELPEQNIWSMPKPIRTSVSVLQPEKFNLFDGCHQKPNQEKGFGKTKSKAMKIYGDLKKVKQPISPGSRLASFLNSLFNAKKAKISSSSSESTKSKSGYESTCSSASSFSRSCLSKTPSSSGGGKLSNGMKRSVRFYPVSVIVDEHCQPCGHKSLYEDEHNSNVRNSINDELKFHIMEQNRRVEEAARDLLKNYQKKVEYEEELQNDDEDEDDAASYASSDLFELDNLSAIGIERYHEELPVYETTHLDTNLAIANGLIT